MTRLLVRLTPSAVFPVLVLVSLLALTVTSLNGSSSAALWHFLYGTRPDAHLLLGSPRPIRSDEWFVNTPLVLAQHVDHYPHVNPDLGDGVDMSLVFDTPYQDWSVAFRPQSAGFALLPLNQAFAFKWWFLAAVLLVSVYALCLRLLPERRLFAALTAVSVLLAPLTQWWFGTSTLGSLAWSCAAAALFGSLLSTRTTWGLVWRTIALAYVLVCFGLLVYPPFQIPCALVVAALSVGLLWSRSSEAPRGAVVRRALAGVGAALAAGITCVVFVLTRSRAVNAIAGTAYPGHRTTTAGGFSFTRLFYGSLTPALLKEPAAKLPGTALGGNASEASTFLLVGVLLLGVQVWLIVRSRRSGLGINPVLASLVVLLLLFLADLFVPWFEPLSRLLLLSFVPHNRLHIGLGLLSTVLVVVTVAELRRQQVSCPRWLLALTGVGTVLVLAVETLEVHRLSPSATGGKVVALVSAVLVLAVVLAFAGGRPTAGAVALVCFCGYAAGGVNPLYRGTFDTGLTPVGQAIRQVDASAPGGWVAVGDLLMNAVMVESGVHSYSGTFSYPGRQPWADLDPTGAYRYVYNRYAHVVFTTSARRGPLRDPQPDEVVALFDPCGAFAQDLVKHVLSEHPLASGCLRFVEEVVMPAHHFYLYDVATEARTPRGS